DRRHALRSILAREGMFNASEGWIFASAEREVSLLDAPRLELLAEARRDLRSPCDEESSARSAVEAMHRIDPLAHLIAQALEQRRSLDAAAAMHRKTARLVDDEEIVVLVEDLDRIVPLLLGC